MITSVPCGQRNRSWSPENISQGSERHGSNAPLQPQHRPNWDQTYPLLQGARQGPAAFMARESTLHARTRGFCLIKRTRCIYDAQTALRAGGTWHISFSSSACAAALAAAGVTVLLLPLDRGSPGTGTAPSPRHVRHLPRSILRRLRY